jgi:hypothetical protein
VLAGWKGYALVLLLGLVLGGFLAGMWQANRYGRQLSELQAAQEAQRAEADRQALHWSERYRESERNAGLARDNIMAQAKKDLDDEKQAAAADLAALRAGTRRLSVAVASCAPSAAGGGVPSDAGAASGSGSARAQLDPTAGSDIYAIGYDGNRGIRDANTCIAVYNAVREQVNRDGE